MEDPSAVLSPRVRRLHGAVAVGVLVLAFGGGLNFVAQTGSIACHGRSLDLRM